jgi:hypothetical protein
VNAVIKRALIKTAKLTKAIQNEKSLPSIQAAASLTHARTKQKVLRLFTSKPIKIIPSYKFLHGTQLYHCSL